jgi:hypothetical protein
VALALTFASSPPWRNGLFAAGVVDQDTPHGLGGRGKEMRAIAPLRLRIAAEA